MLKNETIWLYGRSGSRVPWAIKVGGAPLWRYCPLGYPSGSPEITSTAFTRASVQQLFKNASDVRAPSDCPETPISDGETNPCSGPDPVAAASIDVMTNSMSAGWLNWSS